MEEIATQIKSRIMINVDVSAKNLLYVNKTILGTLLHKVVKMENI